MRHTHLLLFALLLSGSLAAQSVMDVQNYIRIDQFGYLPNGNKVAVLAHAVEGFNEGVGLRTNVGMPVQVIDAGTDAVVYSGYADAWNGGSQDALSGDYGHWFDFTPLTTPGEYVIRVTQVDGSRVDSYPFRIGTDVYDDALRASVNMFYYQRVNQDKTADYAAGAPWTDGAWYDDADQEIATKRLGNPSTTRDLRKGWFDAGDPNKYVTFATSAVHNLLTSYDQHPDFWAGFDLNIPESDNDIPDLLDEVMWEIDWLKAMQDYPGTGGFYQKMGILNDGSYISPPSSDERDRWYNGICVTSTITGAGMLAHAAVSMRDLPGLSAEVTELTERAEAAWQYYLDAPNKDERCDDGQIEAGDADGPGDHYSTEHVAEAVATAVYLFDLTGDAEYDQFISANLTSTRPWNGSPNEWAVYRPNQAEAVMHYLTIDGGNSNVRQQIINLRTSPNKSSSSAYVLQERDNLYRADLVYFNWGSNGLLSSQGGNILDFLAYDLETQRHDRYTERAQGLVNYLHGVNPLGLCYLSNMYAYGGDLCADEMWHSWFRFGTEYDNIEGDNVGPAPGFLSGGANPQGNGAMPIKIGTEQFTATAGTQPSQKAFSVNNDANVAYGPWAYNEPAIYYQSAYVKMLAFFAANAVTGAVDTAAPTYTSGATGDCLEAEDTENFVVNNDVGSNPIAVQTDVNGATDNAYLALPDADDAATFGVAMGSAGTKQLTVRVITGRDAPKEFVDAYTLDQDGDVLDYQLDTTTLTQAIDGIYWGELVTEAKVYSINVHPLTVTAQSGGQGVDRLCYRDPRDVPSGGTGGNTQECKEVEDGFAVLADPGDFNVGPDSFTPGASNDKYINLFDEGDQAGVDFNAAAGGSFEIRVRCRVGEADTSPTNMAGSYTVAVNGTPVDMELDESTVSELFDDTYWGELVGTADIGAGDFQVQVTAGEMWLKLDRICVRNEAAVFNVCGEAEVAFDVVADEGSNASVGADSFTPGSSGNSYLNLFDPGDEVTMPFNVPTAGRYKMSVRVRVGEASGTPTNLADKYTISVNDEVYATTLDESTVTELFDDTHWGFIEIEEVTLEAGDHTLGVRSDHEWLKLDQFCVTSLSTTALPEAAPTGTQLRVQPNPNGGQFVAELTWTQAHTTLQLEVIDLLGQVIHRQTLGVGEGANRNTISLSNTPAGLYLLRLRDTRANWVLTERVLIR